MKLRKLPLLLFFVLLGRPILAAEQPAPQSIILASTTSVENSGLLAHILPAFTKETGITVHALAQGTGQALQTAAPDDADLVLVHDLRPSKNSSRPATASTAGRSRGMILSWSGRAPTLPTSPAPAMRSQH
jgi:ABC-type tungstate transport system permease subunit